MLSVLIRTGSQVFDDRIVSFLRPSLTRLEVSFEEDVKVATIVVCLPEQISLYDKKFMVVLSDDLNLLVEHDNIVEIVPVPVVEDDFRRLEWKLVFLIDLILDGL